MQTGAQVIWESAVVTEVSAPSIRSAVVAALKLTGIDAHPGAVRWLLLATMLLLSDTCRVTPCYAACPFKAQRFELNENHGFVGRGEFAGAAVSPRGVVRLDSLPHAVSRFAVAIPSADALGACCFLCASSYSAWCVVSHWRSARSGTNELADFRCAAGGSVCCCVACGTATARARPRRARSSVRPLLLGLPFSVCSPPAL